jgi:hypothetical protein
MKKLPLFFILVFTASLAVAQEKSAADLEAEFSAMLQNATLKGSWVPIRQGATGEEKNDAYQVVRATRIEGDRWEIVSKAKHQGKEIEYPIPVMVKWAGDTAVMILDEVATGGGKTYSARVMFHTNRYAGSWWGKGQPGGLLSGAITQAKEE